MSIGKRIFKPLLEAFWIFLSILLAFAIQEWDEENKKAEKEAIYLTSLYGDLVKDQNLLSRRIEDYEQKLKVTTECLASLQGWSVLDEAELIQNIASRLTHNFAYYPSNNTYESLESSGDIKFISNASFKILLYELDKSFQTTTLRGDLFLEYTNSKMWAGFIMDNIDFENRTLLKETPGFHNKFINRVVRMRTLIESYDYAMQGTLKKISQVKEALEEEMSAQNIPIPEHALSANSSHDEENVEDEFDDLLEEVQ